MTVARRGRAEAGRAEVRRDLVAGAVALFTEQGYDDTTVDDIAAAAGVGRRTFFRYFRAKEEAVSPDHAAALARVGEIFESAHPTEPPAVLALRAGETVFDLYTEDPALSVARYRLTHEVPALRDRESASVDHYRRLFTRHLRHLLASDTDGESRSHASANRPCRRRMVDCLRESAARRASERRAAFGCARSASSVSSAGS